MFWANFLKKFYQLTAVETSPTPKFTIITDRFCCKSHQIVDGSDNYPGGKNNLLFLVGLMPVIYEYFLQLVSLYCQDQ
jgi:hypothetical protein